MNITAYNPSTTGLEKTYLTSSAAASTNPVVFKVKNTDRFTTGNKVLMGEMGRERSEILTINSLTPTTITLSAPKFNHDADDPLYELSYDEVNFYCSTTGQNGAYNIIATPQLDVDNLDNKTVYNDANSLSSYWYYITYLNSVTGDESDPSPSIQSTGYPDNSVGDTIEQVSIEVDDEDFTFFSIERWIGIMNNVSKDLYKQAKKPYRFLKVKTPIDVETDDISFPWPDDLWKINYIEVNQYNSGLSPLTFTPKLIDNQTMRFRISRSLLPSDYVNSIAYDDEEKAILFTPAARTERLGAFIFHYYKKFTKFTDMSNLIETPDNLVYQYAMKRAYYLRKGDDDSKYLTQFGQYDKMYQAEIRMLQREKNVDVHGPMSMAPDRKRYPQYGAVRYRQ